MTKNAVHIFVSPLGCDDNSGNLDSPLQTLVMAQQRARELKNDNADVTVYLLGGDYPAKQNTITLTKADSGIAYKAYENQRPVIKGGIALDMSRFKSVEDQAVLSRIISAKAREMLYEIDIADCIDGIPHPEYICGKGTPALFADNVHMQISRWPSKKHTEKATLENWLYTVHIEHGNPPNESPFDIKVDYAMLEHMNMFWGEDAVKNVWLAGYLWHNWFFDCYKVKGFDMTSNSVTAQSMGNLPYLCGPEPGYKYRRFFFYNILEEISEPLEYYVDFDAKKLYCCLENLNTQIYIATQEKPFITIDDAENIDIQGIGLMYSTNKMLKISNSRNITVSDCEICCGTDDAGEIEHSSSISILNNRIYNTGSGGLTIHHCGNMKNLESCNVLVDGNDIHDVALKKQNMSCAINIWENMGLTISHNKLHNSQHTLLYIFSGLDTFIEYNEIYDAALDTDDAAAVYWGRTTCVIGTRIRYNYFHDIGQNNSATWCIGAIYTDDLGTSGEIYGNLFENAAIFGDDNSYMQTTHINPTVMLNNAQFVNVHDNIIVASTRREVPITADMSTNSTKEWLMSALGAYIPGNYDSMEKHMQWREQLAAMGFFAENGIDVNPLWKEHFAGTYWNGMLDLLSGEHYSKGAVDVNGNAYGIPDIVARFEQGEIALPEARAMFEEYCECILLKMGEGYTPNVLENNTVVGMNPEHLNENGDFVPRHIKINGNKYISVDEAENLIKDYKWNLKY